MHESNPSGQSSESQPGGRSLFGRFKQYRQRAHQQRRERLAFSILGVEPIIPSEDLRDLGNLDKGVDAATAQRRLATAYANIVNDRFVVDEHGRERPNLDAMPRSEQIALDLLQNTHIRVAVAESIGLAESPRTHIAHLANLLNTMEEGFHGIRPAEAPPVEYALYREDLLAGVHIAMSAYDKSAEN